MKFDKSVGPGERMQRRARRRGATQVIYLSRRGSAIMFNIPRVLYTYASSEREKFITALVPVPIRNDIEPINKDT